MNMDHRNNGNRNNHEDMDVSINNNGVGNNNNNKQGAGILIRTLRKATTPTTTDSNNSTITTNLTSTTTNTMLRCPQPGDSVLIHYEGFLEDGVTAIPDCSSRAIGQPLRFDVSAQQVMEGMDVAVQHMQVGQVVEVTIPHRYAYGASGYPPQIPQKVTLVFRIELLQVQEPRRCLRHGRPWWSLW